LPAVSGSGVMDLFQVHFKTLSNRPWWRRQKEFVEGDLFEYETVVTNDGSARFPPSEMSVTAVWNFRSGQHHATNIRLASGQLAPTESARETALAAVMEDGYALLKIEHHPYGQGCVLHDSGGREINWLAGNAVASFRGISRMELDTLAALYIAAIAALISGVGLLLSIWLR